MRLKLPLCIGVGLLFCLPLSADAEGTDFSEEFKQNLYSCQPATEEYKREFDTINADIIGRESDDCHIRYFNFDMHIPMAEVENIRDFADLNALLQHSEIAQYNADFAYVPDGTMFGLKRCSENENDVSAYMLKRIGDIEVKNVNEYSASEDGCHIRYGREVKNATTIRDYSQICDIPAASINGLLQQFQVYIDEFGPQNYTQDGEELYKAAVTNEQTLMADEFIYNKLKESGYCQTPEARTYTPEDEAKGDTADNNKEDKIRLVVVEPSIFAPELAAKIHKCLPASEEISGKSIEIIGLNKEKKCQISYDGFSLNLPQTILTNIHSEDDLKVLLKNKDMAVYNYTPQYNFSGLIFALQSCLNKTDYIGKQDVIEHDMVHIRRGLYAGYADNICTITLRDEVSIDEVLTDYSVVCRLPAKVMSEIEPYFVEILQKYGAKRRLDKNGRMRTLNPRFNEETRQADLALMYYLQQKGYCKKQRF